MAFSPEYPDLRWMPPASWTDANRTSVQLIVIHTTEGSEGPSSAEDGAAYDQRRTDGTSCHFFCDSDSTIQCVRTADIAHAARTQGNRRGIQYELCGRAGQGTAGWADAASQGTLRQAARQCARDAKRWGIPVRHLSVAQVAAGEKGFSGHCDITRAFPQDNGTHTDPGPDFPWSLFLDMVRAELDGDGDDMDQAQFTALMDTYIERVSGFSGVSDSQKRIRRLWGQAVGTDTVPDALLDRNVTLPDGSTRQVRTLLAYSDQREAQTRQILADAIKAGQLDPASIVAGIVAALPAEQARATVDDLAAQARTVADELAARLAS